MGQYHRNHVTDFESERRWVSSHIHVSIFISISKMDVGSEELSVDGRLFLTDFSNNNVRHLWVASLCIGSVILWSFDQDSPPFILRLGRFRTPLVNIWTPPRICDTKPPRVNTWLYSKLIDPYPEICLIFLSACLGDRTVVNAFFLGKSLRSRLLQKFPYLV